MLAARGQSRHPARSLSAALVARGGNSPVRPSKDRSIGIWHQRKARVFHACMHACNLINYTQAEKALPPERPPTNVLVVSKRRFATTFSPVHAGQNSGDPFHSVKAVLKLYDDLRLVLATAATHLCLTQSATPGGHARWQEGGGGRRPAACAGEHYATLHATSSAPARSFSLFTPHVRWASP